MIYMIDRDRMGKFQSDRDAVVQRIECARGRLRREGPAPTDPNQLKVVVPWYVRLGN